MTNKTNEQNKTTWHTGPVTKIEKVVTESVSGRHYISKYVWGNTGEEWNKRGKRSTSY